MSDDLTPGTPEQDGGVPDARRDVAYSGENLTIAPGRVVAEPGAVIAAIDKETRPHSGQEMRLHPSTYNTASIGGFIAGGSGGVGSIRWGGLRAYGNILGLKVITCEAEPRILDLRGPDILKVAHAYGTNGIIVEAHPRPEEALCDAPQLIRTSDFAGFATELRDLVALMGKVVG